jgi:hypothetical protein
VKIVFSRKGFDSSAGGVPSPIVGGRPISLPIPEKPPSPTTYDVLGLGQTVEQATRGRIGRHATCHDDPMFADGHCWLGQAGSAQGHLRRNGVGAGDVFLFFGLFREPTTGERHHRIFGYMRVACFGPPEQIRGLSPWREPPRPHPHLSDRVRRQNTIYFGPGATAGNAGQSLRLTISDGPLNIWRLPDCLALFGLTYHANPDRWLGNGKLDSAKRGQEFVCDVGDNGEALQWVEGMIAEISRRPESTAMS